jgi:hypothetical protein
MRTVIHKLFLLRDRNCSHHFHVRSAGKTIIESLGKGFFVFVRVSCAG